MTPPPFNTWIPHDGGEGPHPQPGGCGVTLEVTGPGIRPMPDQTIRPDYPGWFWRWRRIRTGLFRWQRRRLCDDPAYAPIIAYCFNRPPTAAIAILRAIARDPQAPVLAPEGPIRAPAGQPARTHLMPPSGRLGRLQSAIWGGWACAGVRGGRHPRPVISTTCAAAGEVGEVGEDETHPRPYRQCNGCGAATAGQNLFHVWVKTSSLTSPTSLFRAKPLKTQRQIVAQDAFATSPAPVRNLPNLPSQNCSNQDDALQTLQSTRY